MKVTTKVIWKSMKMWINLFDLSHKRLNRNLFGCVASEIHTHTHTYTLTDLTVGIRSNE